MKMAIAVVNCTSAPFFLGLPGAGLPPNRFCFDVNLGVVQVRCSTNCFYETPGSSFEKLIATVQNSLLGCAFLSTRVASRSDALQISCERAYFEVRKVNYRPPGTEYNLLNEVSFSLAEKSFGLIFGRSGSGKTTLLHLLAGLTTPTSGSITFQKYRNDGGPSHSTEPLAPERVGMVFQFPERYFLADTIIEEMTFGWPRQKADFALREQLALNLQYAINSVGLNTISLDEDPHSLSGGYKRRLALAIQLAQTPQLLVLDEPLAGLDWKARADIVRLLRHLKKELTILVVSHDLKELSSLVDRSWRMQMGGIMKEEALPV